MKSSLCFVLALLLPIAVLSQNVGNRSASKANRILIQELVISGATTLNSQQLNEIVNSLTALEMDANGKELKERLRDSFQQHGYFAANVKTAEIKPLDPLARPMPVRVEADVDEGPRFRFSPIKFVGNHVLSAEQLQAQFPFHTGDLFEIGKVRSGLESLRKLYGSMGYMNFSLVDKTDTNSGGGSAATIRLTFEVHEGSQYRMGKLDLTGDKEVALQLQNRWELEPGKPFDAEYLERFVEENRTLLGADFNAESDTDFSLDCRELTVSVQIQLDLTHPLKPIPSKLDCDAAQEAKPDSARR